MKKRAKPDNCSSVDLTLPANTQLLKKKKNVWEPGFVLLAEWQFLLKKKKKKPQVQYVFKTWTVTFENSVIVLELYFANNLSTTT
jgi:hypothetical protein